LFLERRFVFERVSIAAFVLDREIVRKAVAKSLFCKVVSVVRFHCPELQKGNVSADRIESVNFRRNCIPAVSATASVPN
jgi:hypothetical protein